MIILVFKKYHHNSYCIVSFDEYTISDLVLIKHNSGEVMKNQNAACNYAAVKSATQMWH